jgi:hypothetical protein
MQQEVTYHGLHAEHVAVVTLTGVVLGDVRKVGQVVSILARTVDVANLVPTHQFLRSTRIAIKAGFRRIRPQIL